MLCDGCQMGGEWPVYKLIVRLHGFAVLFFARIVSALLVSKNARKKACYTLHSGRPKTNYSI